MKLPGSNKFRMLEKLSLAPYSPIARRLSAPTCTTPRRRCSARRNNAGLRRAWWHACKEENIDPRNPTRLPLLFALDGKFSIADGFRYAADCSALRKGGDGTVYCGGDFGGSGGGDGSDGFGDSGGDGGCGGGCGGGGGD